MVLCRLGIRAISICAKIETSQLPGYLGLDGNFDNSVSTARGFRCLLRSTKRFFLDMIGIYPCDAYTVTFAASLEFCAAPTSRSLLVAFLVQTFAGPTAPTRAPPKAELVRHLARAGATVWSHTSMIVERVWGNSKELKVLLEPLSHRRVSLP